MQSIIRASCNRSMVSVFFMPPLSANKYVEKKERMRWLFREERVKTIFVVVERAVARNAVTFVFKHEPHVFDLLVQLLELSLDALSCLYQFLDISFLGHGELEEMGSSS